MSLKHKLFAGLFAVSIGLTGCGSDSIVQNSNTNPVRKEPCEYGEVKGVYYDASSERLRLKIWLVGHKQGIRFKTYYGMEARRLYQTTRVGDHVSYCYKPEGDFQNTSRHKDIHR